MTEDVLKQQQRTLLEWFVIRARRVEEHSLAQDKEQLLAWASVSITVVVRAEDGQPQTVRWHLPPEEPLDSLAARCRPFVLNDDAVYWAKVTKALRSVLRGTDAEDLTAAVQRLRDAWGALDKNKPGFEVYESRAGDENGVLGELIGTKALAYAWLYGDLVHANDDTLERVGDHDINDRYRAGAHLITNIAFRVIETLNLVREAQRRGLLGLTDEVFSQSVAADPDVELTVSQLATGPAGATAAELEAILDADGGTALIALSDPAPG